MQPGKEIQLRSPAGAEKKENRQVYLKNNVSLTKERRRHKVYAA